MQNASEIDSDELRRTRAMSWIGDLLEKIASDLGVMIGSRTWEVDSGAGDAKAYHLVVVGARDRRTVKLFTSSELDLCLFDNELQSEIHSRLARLVAFLGNRADGTSAKRAMRKRREPERS